MWYLSELVFKSYFPKELKEGMLFMSIFNQGTVKEFVNVWSLGKTFDSVDNFLIKNGAPIKLYIVDEDENVIAKSKTIGWFDFGETISTLSEISLKEINIILNEFNGLVEIKINDIFYEKKDRIAAIIEEEKVILRFTEE